MVGDSLVDLLYWEDGSTKLPHFSSLVETPNTPFAVISQVEASIYRPGWRQISRYAVQQAEGLYTSDLKRPCTKEHPNLSFLSHKNEKDSYFLVQTKYSAVFPKGYIPTPNHRQTIQVRKPKKHLIQSHLPNPPLPFQPNHSLPPIHLTTPFTPLTIVAHTHPVCKLPLTIPNPTSAAQLSTNTTLKEPQNCPRV